MLNGGMLYAARKLRCGCCNRRCKESAACASISSSAGSRPSKSLRAGSVLGAGAAPEAYRSGARLRRPRTSGKPST